ncbi:LptE family protein [bacterium]|nr:LptE family protein [bacterium]
MDNRVISKLPMTFGRWTWILPSLLLAIICGCGYSLVGKGGVLPTHVKTIGVPVFKNETFEIGLEALVTDAIVARLMKRGGFDVSDSSPDARLRGSVVEYELKRLAYDTRGIPNEFRVKITIEAELFDLKDQKAICAKKKYWVKKDYNIDEDVSDLYRQGQEQDSQVLRTREQSRKEAISLATEDLAKDMVSAMLDKF